MNTSLLLCLVGGIAIGWLAEYLLDLRFWRQSNKRLQADYAALERQLASIEVDSSTLQIHSAEATDMLTERDNMITQRDKEISQRDSLLMQRDREIKNLKSLSRLLSVQLKRAQSERDAAVTQAKRMHTELAQAKMGYEPTQLLEPTIIEFQSNSTVSERLNKAGVKTLDALANLSDRELYDIVSSEKKRLAKGQGAWRSAAA